MRYLIRYTNDTYESPLQDQINFWCDGPEAEFDLHSIVVLDASIRRFLVTYVKKDNENINSAEKKESD
jgi:hypothetical protein